VSSIAVRSRSHGHRPPSGDEWITTDQHITSSKVADDDAWLDVADSHLSEPGDAVVVALARRKLRILADDDPDLLAGYTEEDSDLEMSEDINAVIEGWDD
jgi:hypothetical protein